ncbi:hypothetical protein OVY29_05305 [Sphingopyxis sp. SE2]|uniref:hypothetical protein n=1 Tax=Sphingopyxis sp. SE2 TaxID=1586240 RepID=UPI0028C08A28|nr:hypothetical protein [Sphingopyxis sp. SE2]MDT7528075.1 hypothetical protein [Sphingopyxis sp. SE2]
MATTAAAAGRTAARARRPRRPVTQTGLGWTVARVGRHRQTRAHSWRRRAKITELAKNKADEAIVDYYNAIQDAVNSGASVEEVAAEPQAPACRSPSVAAERPCAAAARLRARARTRPRSSHRPFQAAGERGHITTIVEE